MDARARDERPLQLSADHRASVDLIKQIRKLRWMGMEDEAKALQETLRTRGDGSVLVITGDTD